MPDPATLNTVLLVVGIPVLAWLARAVSKLAKSAGAIETVVTGYKADTGLVGRVEVIGARLHKAENRIAALAVAVGLEKEGA